MTTPISPSPRLPGRRAGAENEESANRARRGRGGRIKTKPWNPSLPPIAPLALVVDWEGMGGPQEIPFTLVQPIELTDGVRATKGAAWGAPAFGLKILATIDNTQHGRLLHVSVSHDRVLPPWPVMIAVKRLFFPESVAAVMVMPESEVYVNEHQRCLHVWQLPEKWGVG